jgi:hypothetical protein
VYRLTGSVRAQICRACTPCYVLRATCYDMRGSTRGSVHSWLLPGLTVADTARQRISSTDLLLSPLRRCATCCCCRRRCCGRCCVCCCCCCDDVLLRCCCCCWLLLTLLCLPVISTSSRNRNSAAAEPWRISRRHWGCCRAWRWLPACLAPRCLAPAPPRSAADRRRRPPAGSQDQEAASSRIGGGPCASRPASKKLRTFLLDDTSGVLVNY